MHSGINGGHTVINNMGQATVNGGRSESSRRGEWSYAPLAVEHGHVGEELGKHGHLSSYSFPSSISSSCICHPLPSCVCHTPATTLGTHHDSCIRFMERLHFPRVSTPLALIRTILSAKHDTFSTQMCDAVEVLEQVALTLASDLRQQRDPASKPPRKGSIWRQLTIGTSAASSF